MIDALALVVAERSRQETTRNGWTCRNPQVTDLERLSALMEEVGEVARCFNEDETPEALRSELVQVAAVAVGWIEYLG